MSILIENRDLLEQFKIGEQQALLAVYQQYVSDVENLVRLGFTDVHTNAKIFGNTDLETQKELIQEIFIKAFSQSARIAYDGIRPYKVFLFTIAKNVMIDHARKSQRDALRHVTTAGNDESGQFDASSLHQWNVETDESGFSSFSSSEEKLHFEKCLREVDAFLATRSNEMQRFVELRFFREMPQRDLAKAMGITRWKTRSLEKKVVGELKKYLTQKKLL